MKRLFLISILCLGMQSAFSQTIFDSKFFKLDGKPLTISCDGDSVTTGFPINGKYSINLNGDFGGGDVVLAFGVNGTTWTALNNPTYEADTVVNVELSGFFRFELQNSTNPDLDISIIKIK